MALPPRPPHLGDLDDPLLRHCLSFLAPLPDLFNVAASCRRFRDLALDRRSWLFVTHAAAAAAPTPPPRRAERPRTPSAGALASPGGEPGGPGGEVEEEQAPHWYRSRFATLAAAVAASRPGDTILLEAGPVAHAVVEPVAVPHPLHILGGGASAEACVLQGAERLDALLDFRASGRLANLTLRAVSGACVAHSRGRLTVQGCTLECDARGLPHLVAPLLTRAVSWPAGPAPPPRRGAKRPAGGPEAAGTAVEPAAARRARERRAEAEAAAGPGALSLVESRVKARGSAVDLRGSGRLSAVRCIYRQAHALMWLEVDSADVAGVPACLPGAPAAAGAAPAVAPACGSGADEPAAAVRAPRVAAAPPPVWAARAAAAGFDPAAFQRRAQALLSAAGRPQGQPQQLQPCEPTGAGARAGSLAAKADEWCAARAAALAGGAPPAQQQRHRHASPAP